MRRADIHADQSTFASILNASANLALISLGKQLHAHVIIARFESNIYCGSALLDMYAKCGSFKDSAAIFGSMPERNGISWNAMISAYAKDGDAEATFRSFEEMANPGFRPDHISFLSVLTACSHNERVDEALRYFDTMTQTHGLVPRKEHYASLVDVLCRRGRFAEAEDWMDRMPFEPDVVLGFELMQDPQESGVCKKGGL
ncbi:Putative pentatricopeptide repeat-containing protein [Striga hermonthica]|uniref:Pentatricopeptide repeat-containing protein n=1 Tax=Striga hermonthica TaxID=68872 RepID=A0A9N7NRH1_STRHE|nr:Putative pentatricopeptide repeat-containing protein [Striga hermonthica]